MTEVQEAAIVEAPARREDAAVCVHELRKEFKLRDRKRGQRTRVALGGVSFSIERGETVAILGQNGSGKSTLVRRVLAYARPYRAHIGLLLVAEPLQRQGIGAVGRHFAAMLSACVKLRRCMP